VYVSNVYGIRCINRDHYNLYWMLINTKWDLNYLIVGNNLLIYESIRNEFEQTIGSYRTHTIGT